MSKRLVIGLDVDEVLADMHRHWLAWGNERFGTWHQEFNDWDDPYEYWGKEAGEFLTPELYSQDQVLPYPGARGAVSQLRQNGHQIRFVTTCSPGSENAKETWLYRHGFLLDHNEFMSRKNKANAFVDLLVDDGLHNCEAFKGWAILVTRPHNRVKHWPGQRISHVEELINIVR